MRFYFCALATLLAVSGIDVEFLYVGDIHDIQKLNENQVAGLMIRGCGRFLGDDHAAIPWL